VDFSHLIRVSAARFPARTAIAYRDTTLSFAELDRLVNRAAAAFLGREIGKAPVASIVFNDPSAICLYLALARCGAVCVPINNRLHRSEKAFIIDNAAAETLVVDGVGLEEAEALLDRCASLKRLVIVNATESSSPWPTLDDLIAASPGDDIELVIDEEQTATIMYTAGTTGFPKGVTRTHRGNLWAVTNSLLGLPRFPADVDLFCFPLFGVGFLFHAMPALSTGAMLVLDRSFDPERAWQLIERHGVTTTSVAPTMIASMLAVRGSEHYDVSSVRYIGVAYEFPRKLREAALERFGNIFINQYGLTEAQLCCTRLGEFAEDPTNVG
jgi:acyl-CoA synthetase (AMP-forming)/AMP-acid ligase II